MQIELTQEQTFSARAGDKLVHGLRITSEWEGLRKLVDGTGRHMIVDADGIVIKATPALLHDLHLTVLADGFVTVPATTLPTGYTVPSFQVAQYHASMADDGTVTVDGSGKPKVNISYHAARDACTDHGYKLITELQCLAIAHNIAQQDINWSGGKVGAGYIYQGIHNGNVNGPQAANYEPGENERRWHELSNGARVYDFAGNVWSWVFDDVQGDIDGLVKGSIAKDSPSLTCAPAPSGEKGVGYIPAGPLNWSGYALIRGGCWFSFSSAGVFLLRSGSPGVGGSYVGFRCTK
ncbi:MAG: SUMF1/EgtB/PvdO family nonheme iron enzyme [Pseudomonadota bacterium]